VELLAGGVAPEPLGFPPPIGLVVVSAGRPPVDVEVDEPPLPSGSWLLVPAVLVPDVVVVAVLWLPLPQDCWPIGQDDEAEFEEAGWPVGGAVAVLAGVITGAPAPEGEVPPLPSADFELEAATR
jgi:hypothetical protein